MKIDISLTEIEVNDLAKNICDNNGTDAIFELIKEMELMIADFNFLEQLKKYFDEQHLKEC